MRNGRVHDCATSMHQGEEMVLTGAYNACPVCQAALAASPSEPIAERHCPRCQAGLWALVPPSGPVFFVRRPGQSCADFIAALAVPALGMSARQVASVLAGADSLDLVEFLAELQSAAVSLDQRPAK
jgi:hypothetical protein